MTDRPLEEQVRYRVDGAVAWIVLNRPEAGNALTPEQRDHVIALLEGVSADQGIRAVVLTATGSRHFCTGADLRAAGDIGVAPRAPGAVARLIAGGAQRLVAAVMDCEKPVIAAVNGTAAGIGAHLCFASDLVIASETARFIEAFVRRGIVPDGGGIYLLPRLIGLQKAKQLMFFGDDLSAAEAERLGLVNLVVAADKVEETARQWAERLASGPTVAISQAKRLLNRSLDSDRATAFAEEANAQEITSTSVDSQEGVAAFRQRRTPEFKGW